jgi:hypothetical protein
MRTTSAQLIPGGLNPSYRRIVGDVQVTPRSGESTHHCTYVWDLDFHGHPRIRSAKGAAVSIALPRIVLRLRAPSSCPDPFAESLDEGGARRRETIDGYSSLDPSRENIPHLDFSLLRERVLDALVGTASSVFHYWLCSSSSSVIVVLNRPPVPVVSRTLGKRLRTTITEDDFRIFFSRANVNADRFLMSFQESGRASCWPSIRVLRPRFSATRHLN